MLATLLSAGLAAVALPPWDLHALAWVALVPFFLVLRTASLSGVLAAGLLWGIAHHWMTASWVLPAMTEYYLQPWWFAFAFGVVTSVIFRGTFAAVFAVVATFAGRGIRPLARATLFATTWTAVDVLRVHGPTGDPWLLFGYALMPYEHLIQTADITGIYGLTFLVVFVNAAVAEVAAHASQGLHPWLVSPAPVGAAASSAPEGRRSSARGEAPGSSGSRALLPVTLTALASVGVAYAYGAYRLATPLPQQPAVSVAVIQGNNDMSAQWQPELHGRSLDDYVQLSATAIGDQPPQVIIWPESAVTFFLAGEEAHRRRVERFARAAGTELIIGAPHYERDGNETRFFNSAFLISADGTLAGRYDKVRLLPFAEYFPLRFGSFLRRSFGRIRTFTPGEEGVLLDTRLGKTAVAICFEAIFPDLVRERMAAGADVLINLSNDIWLGRGAGPRQHFAMVPLRAIENRTWVIRSTTTGISAVVDPWGRVREVGPLAATAALAVAVVPMRVDTIYEAWGDWFGGLCLMGVVAGFVFGFGGRARLWAIAAVAAIWLAAPRTTLASCDQIPGAVGSFRGALGELDRPFAGPGDFVRVDLTNDCATSSGFLDTAAQHVVTVAFQPPNGRRNLVMLSADCSAIDPQTCAGRNDIASASCVENPDSIELIASGTQGSLRFRFPDTDALLPPDDDSRTFTGPAAIAVTAVDAALPCDLASTRCSDLDGAIACVDRLYAATSVCGQVAHELFPQFTALPPANDFRSLCTTIGSECIGSASEVRMTVDAEGNLLLPMDWSGILLGERVPFARLVRASSSVEAFPGSGQPIRLPSENFLQSVSLNGGLLPALFEPQLDPSAASELSLFGAADAPRTVLRFGRRGSTRRSCSGGSNDGYPCITSSDCPGGICGESTCADDPGKSCGADEDCSDECGPSYFDFSTRLFQGVGPILIARRGPGVCEDDGEACATDADCGSSLCVSYRLSTDDPVLIDGVFESETLRVSVIPEGIAGRDLNGDGDLTDEVILLSDRETGRALPIGFGTVGQRPLGRAVTIVRQGAFRDPGLALSGDLVAFLEAEPLQWGRDLNGDGDQADSFLRVFRREQEITAGQNVNVDAAPMIDGKPVAILGDRVLFRSQESASARLEILRISSNGSGAAASGRSRRPHISRDGRWVAFESTAHDLVDGSLGSTERVFIYGTETGTTVQIAPQLGDLIDTDGPAHSPWLSGDGRHVALVAPDSTGLQQVWMYDRDTDADGIFDEPGETITNFGSVAQRELRPAAGEILFPAMNAGGRILTFVGRASDLRTQGDDRVWLTYWHDRDPDGNGVPSEPGKYSTNLASEAPIGREPNLHSVFQPAPVSDDGDAVAYASYARDIVEGDTNEACLNLFPDDQSSGNCSDVFLFSYWETTARVSIGNQGQQGNQASLTPAMSADGGLVAFLSFASNLVPGDTNGVADVFVRDVRKRSTVRVSVTATGEEADASSFGASLSMSADGRYVAYASSAGNLVDGDDNFVCDNDLDGVGGENCFDVFLHDRFSGFTRRVSATGPDSDGNERSTRPSISGDGQIVAFQSRASNLVDNDDNRFCDNNLDGENDENCSDVFVARPHPDDVATADLSGDGDLDDTLLRVLDASSGELLTLCPADEVVTAGDLVVFLRPESAGQAAGCPTGEKLRHGVDLNGDGDADDLVVHRWRPGGAPENLRLAASAIAASEKWIAALRPEPLEPRGREFGNDNGPVRHLLIHSASGAAGDWIDLEEVADVIQVVGDHVAFSFPEYTYSPNLRDPPRENDLTGNARLLPPDRVPFLYDAAAQRRIAFKSPFLGDFHLSATDFVLGRNLFAFVTEEFSQNGDSSPATCDFNRDGDCDDVTLFVYDIERDVLHDTRQTIVPCPIELCDPSQPFIVLDHTVRFLTLESEQGEDLNGDGDLDDLVVQTFNAEAVANAPVGGIGGGAQDGTRAGLRVIGAVEAGVCTDTRAACVDSRDCLGGECHVPPGRCALPTSITCDPVSGRDACGVDAFCVPSLAGTGACRLKQGVCFDDSDCDSPARCIDRGGSERRFLNPLRVADGGGHVFSSAGECVEDLGVACSVGAMQCPNGATCEAMQPGLPEGVCRRFLGSCSVDENCPASAICRPSLVVTSAVDTDGDEVPDAFDNCVDDANSDQLDSDSDGVGDACQRQVVINGPENRSVSDDGCAMTGNRGGGGWWLVVLIGIIFRASSPSRKERGPFSWRPWVLAACFVLMLRPAKAQVTTCPGDCGGDGRVTASDLVMVTRVALGMNAEVHCSAADTDGSGNIDEAELRAAVEALFSPCAPLSAGEALSLVLSTIRATERAALGLLSGFQFVNGAAEDAPPGSEAGACPRGGSQRRGCEVLDDTFVSIPFEMDACSYLGDDAFVTADGGFSLVGIGSCPGLFVLSGSRLILDLAVTTGLPPVVDFYAIALRGSIDEITLASGGCSLSYIAVPFSGAIDSELARGERLGIQTESGLLEASFGRQPCRPTAVSFTFDGRGGAHDTGTTPFAVFDATFDELAISIDVTPRLSTVVDVSGVVTPACAARRLTLSSTVPLTWSNGCPTGGALRVGAGSQVIDVLFSADGTGAVDLDGDGEAELTIDGCGGSVPPACGVPTRAPAAIISSPHPHRHPSAVSF